MLLSNRMSVRVQIGRKGTLGMGEARMVARDLSLPLIVFLGVLYEREVSRWPHPTGGCAKIVNGGRLIQRRV
jgi:hypothetical protein